MEKPIRLTTADTIISIIKENVQETNNLSLRQANKVFQKLLTFLSTINRNFIRVDEDEPVDVIIRPSRNFSSLRLFLDTMIRIFTYLNDNDIPFYFDNSRFDFTGNTGNGGLLVFDYDKKLFKAYYLDPDFKRYGEFVKIKIPFGSKDKL